MRIIRKCTNYMDIYFKRITTFGKWIQYCKYVIAYYPKKSSKMPSTVMNAMQDSWNVLLIANILIAWWSVLKTMQNVPIIECAIDIWIRRHDVLAYLTTISVVYLLFLKNELNSHA